MKVGILTFHSQLNYGGVLQACALRTVLDSLGYETVVLDRWLDPTNCLLERGYNRNRLSTVLKLVLKTLLCCRVVEPWMRSRRTKRFIRDFVKISPYHFVDWNQAPLDLGVDCIVVGSDQVWHSGDFNDPRPYLLRGAPADVTAIAYAASFGMAEIPPFLGDGACSDRNAPAMPFYVDGFHRFAAISCREDEGVAICKGLGFSAVRVVDPVLLLSARQWESILCKKRVPYSRTKKKRLFCYFLERISKKEILALNAFAEANDCEVDLIFDSPPPGWNRSLRTLLKSKGKYPDSLSSSASRNLHFRVSAGPREFLTCISQATWVVTDSFHALMFSMVFGSNVRVLRPQSGMRVNMFSRIQEIADHFSHSPISDDLHSSLESLTKDEMTKVDADWLSSEICRSLEFLKFQLGKVASTLSNEQGDRTK